MPNSLAAVRQLIFLVLFYISAVPHGRTFTPTPHQTEQTALLQRSPVALQDAYSFDSPDQVFKLDSDLKEISGLTVFDQDHLAVVEDEKGKVYTVEISSGEIAEDHRFDKDGDYEGIENVEGQLYVLRSDGDIYQIDGWPPKSKEAKKHATFLSSKYDTEGLAYDPIGRRLLVACKEYAGDNLPHHKAIYAYDLATSAMSDMPAYLIDLNELEKRPSDNALNRFVRRLVAPVTDLSGFKPAAIAIHPINHQVFVVSSVRKMLLSLKPDSSIDALWVLPEEHFKQPEGLAFLPNGDLFISNEGGGGKATLLRFNYRG